MVIDVVLPAVLGLVLVREAGIETCRNRQDQYEQLLELRTLECRRWKSVGVDGLLEDSLVTY